MFSILVFCTFNAFAQSSDENQIINSTLKDRSFDTALIGTFYIKSKNKVKEVFTTQKLLDIKNLVQSNRQNDQRVTLSISQLSDVIVLSLNEIKDPSFVPIEGLYID